MSSPFTPLSVFSRAAKTGWALLSRGRRMVSMHRRAHRRLSVRDAYRRWSETYDAEPGNVVLDFEREIFDDLISDTAVERSVVVDIGCGTGRHWEQLLSRRPGILHGVDLSPEMLACLRTRYPSASLHLRLKSKLPEFADNSVDIVVSGLMLGYVQDLDEELREWRRLLKVGGEIILTDFHPDALATGAKRTFAHRGRWFEIENYVHTLDALRSRFRSLNLEVLAFRENAFSERSGALATPIIMGFRLRRTE